MFRVTGEDFITIIVNRLNDKDVRCHDSEIVNQIRRMTDKEVVQALTSGDVQRWHNDRIRAAGLSDYKDKNTGSGAKPL